MKGTAAALDTRHGLTEAVHVSFKLTLTATITASETDTVTAETTTVTPCGLAQPASSLSTLPLPARLAEDSVWLSTAYRLLPDLLIPLSAAPPLMEKSELQAAAPVLRFEWCEADEPPPHSSFRIVDVFEFHRQRLLAAQEESLCPADEQQAPLHSHPRFFSLCPAVRLLSCSIRVEYSPASQLAAGSSWRCNVRATYSCAAFMSFIRQCGSDCGAMQRLQQKSMSDLQGQARATYTLAGSTEVLECRANLSVFVRARPHDARLAFDGDCRSMMQMADILAANCDQSRPSTSSANPLSLSPPSSAPAPLSSFTALTCRPLETILAAQLPSLTPCNLPAGYSAEGINEYRGMHGMHMPDLSNWLRCDYDERSHRIKVIASHNLTLSCVDPSCPATPRLYMLLDSRWPEQGEDAFALYHVRLAHVIRRQATERIVPEDTFAASATPMSLSQLLSLIQLPVELLPRNLHDRVHFSDVHATLIVDSVNGVLTSVAGTATCGVSRADKLLFFNRLPAVASSLPESRQTRSILPHLNEVVHSPVVRWCSLQCRSVLDTAVFPSIHMYTSDRCVAPLYQYMLCETEGDVELSARATREFRAGHRKLAGYSKIHTDLPAQLRPTNALFALQPHLPIGLLGNADISPRPLLFLRFTTRTRLYHLHIIVLPSVFSRGFVDSLSSGRWSF